MNEKELYGELGRLTKRKDQWQANIGSVASLLSGQSAKITGKALWLLGEMGLLYPSETGPFAGQIAAFLTVEDPFLRERALNALGRMGRADFELVRPYLPRMLSLADDGTPKVRLAFIWASENIAVTTPGAYESSVSVFERLLEDENVRVRMEAPEMFRVLGKRKPEYVRHCLDKLRVLSEQDPHRVVRIHAAGAVKAISASGEAGRM